LVLQGRLSVVADGDEEIFFCGGGEGFSGFCFEGNLNRFNDGMVML